MFCDLVWLILETLQYPWCAELFRGNHKTIIYIFGWLCVRLQYLQCISNAHCKNPLHLHNCEKLIITFLPEASFGLRVLSFPASECVSVCLSVFQSLACPRDNLFKLGSPNLDHRVKRPWSRTLFVFGGDWPWPSRSNLTSKSKFTPFWACPCHNSPPIEVTISKFNQVGWLWRHWPIVTSPKSCLHA